MERMDEEEILHISPYVVQIEKFANSLKQLSNTFLQMQSEKQTFNSREIEEMFFCVKEDVCSCCENCEQCWKENVIRTYQMGYEILSAIDGYGDELNIELKRKIQMRCFHSAEFIKKMLEVYHDAKHNLLWERRMEGNRAGCAMQLDVFAEIIRRETKEIEDSIISDTRLEKKLEIELSKKGIKVLYVTILINAEGKYELYITACAKKSGNLTYQEYAEYVSEIMRKRMVVQNVSQGVLGHDYTTTIFIEGPMYYVLSGIAKIGKECNQISGDNFMVIELSGGKQCIAISDGMGAGENANIESGRVIDLLEELLRAGYPEETAIQMINLTLTMGSEEIHFSTVDLCSIYLYSGKCRIYKAGASSTFIKRGRSVEHIHSTSLPVGVVQQLKVDYKECQLDHGDFIIMVTDGIMDALPVGEQDLILETIIKGTDKNNAKEMAHHILEQALEWNGRKPLDDMTVLVASLWRFV